MPFYIVGQCNSVWSQDRDLQVVEFPFFFIFVIFFTFLDFCSTRSEIQSRLNVEAFADSPVVDQSDIKTYAVFEIVLIIRFAFSARHFAVVFVIDVGEVQAGSDTKSRFLCSSTKYHPGSHNCQHNNFFHNWLFSTLDSQRGKFKIKKAWELFCLSYKGILSNSHRK